MTRATDIPARIECWGAFAPSRQSPETQNRDALAPANGLPPPNSATVVVGLASQQPARFSNRMHCMMWLRRHAAKTCFWLADRFADLGYFFWRPIREMAERLEGRR